MHRKNINRIFCIVAVLLLLGCNSNKGDLCTLLPNGKLLKCNTVNELDSLYNLTYQHYQGFTGVMEDETLKGFTVIIKDQANKVGRDVASDDYIETLKNERILGLKFNKIPDSIMSYADVLKYVSKHYPKLDKIEVQSNLEVGIDKEINYTNKNKEVIVKVQYSKLGISGSFVIVKSTPCK